MVSIVRQKIVDYRITDETKRMRRGKVAGPNKW